MRRHDPSRRHMAFKLYVIRRLKRSQSVIRRVLYFTVLYYLFHSDEEGVDIRLRHPTATKPQPRESKGHRYFSFTKKRMVGLFA